MYIPIFPLFYFVVENLQLGFITSFYLGRKPVLLSELMSGCVQPSLLGEEGRPDSLEWCDSSLIYNVHVLLNQNRDS